MVDKWLILVNLSQNNHLRLTCKPKVLGQTAIIPSKCNHILPMLEVVS